MGRNMPGPLWKSQEISAAIGQEVPSTISANGVSIDTRTVRKGDLFVGLKGENHDGGDFAKKALENGASLCLVNATCKPDDDPRIIRVADTTQALVGLARYRRQQFTGTLIGITGSVGKTSTKEMLAQMLAGFGSIHFTQGNYNNHFGVPLTLANMAADTDFAIIEMGMNHAGEIRELTKIARPHVAVISSIACNHLEFFASIEAIAAAKAEIFEGLEGSKTIVLGKKAESYNPIQEAAARYAEKVYAVDNPNVVKLNSINADEDGSEVSAEVLGKAIHYHIRAAGEHLAYNSLLALTTGAALGLTPKACAQALAGFQSLAGRGSVIKHKDLKIIDETYNASPESTRAALEGLSLHKGRKIAVLGDMLELGPQSRQLHESLKDVIITCGIDRVFTVGPMMQHLHEILPSEIRGEHSATASEMTTVLKPRLQAQDTVLIKGSNGIRMKQIVQSIVDDGN
jgi:UDP-N-acetylmuramoyl-tripeptide--D-alanyl-D-alanine ligase